MAFSFLIVLSDLRLSFRFHFVKNFGRFTQILVIFAENIKSSELLVDLLVLMLIVLVAFNLQTGIILITFGEYKTVVLVIINFRLIRL